MEFMFLIFAIVATTMGVAILKSPHHFQKHAVERTDLSKKYFGKIPGYSWLLDWNRNWYKTDVYVWQLRLSGLALSSFGIACAIYFAYSLLTG